MLMRHLEFDSLPDRAGPHHHIAFTRIADEGPTFLHTHDFPEFFLVTNGVGVHCWNYQDFTLERGWLVFIRPVDIHNYRSSETQPLEFINLALQRAWWERFRLLFTPPVQFDEGQPGAPAAHRRLAASTVSRLETILQKLLECDAYDPALLVQTVVGLVSSLLAPKVAPERIADPELPAWLARFRRELQQPDLLPHPIGFWQRRCGRSPEHLARSCRRYFGQSPTEMLNRARVERFKARLLRGEDKIAYLALDAGFENLGYFYRVFRRFEGCTPKAWLQARARLAGGIVPG